MEVKSLVSKDAWISLKQYFDGRGNGSEAKVACVVIGAIAKEEQTKSHNRQIDLVIKKMGMDHLSEPKRLKK